MRKNSHCEYAEKDAEKIITGHEGPLLRYAMRILGDSSLAQNAVESAFIMVLSRRKRQAGLSRDDLTAELYRAVHGAAVALIPLRKRLQEKANVSFPVTADEGERAMEAVHRLNPEEQQMVILKIYERMTNSEISRITQKDEENVATLLYKSVIKVADELKKAGLL